jgi:hypothetical protein
LPSVIGGPGGSRLWLRILRSMTELVGWNRS